METKKALACFGVLILGSVITVAIDHLIGASFKDVGIVAQITHKSAYMLWGGALLSVANWSMSNWSE